MSRLQRQRFHNFAVWCEITTSGIISMSFLKIVGLLENSSLFEEITKFEYHGKVCFLLRRGPGFNPWPSLSFFVNFLFCLIHLI